MELINAIESRRSIRKYLDKMVEKELILDIISAGHLAPSAKNRQPWYFIVVSTDIKNKIADMMIKHAEAHPNEEKLSTVIPTATFMKEGNTLILILKSIDNDYLVNDTLSIGACIENMCLRATDLGLGALWIRDIIHVEKDVLELINHHELELSSALLLGYPNQSPKPRPRKDVDTIIEWY